MKVQKVEEIYIGRCEFGIIFSFDNEDNAKEWVDTMNDGKKDGPYWYEPCIFVRAGD